MIHMLTTVDNPFDPFDEYDQWLAFDEQFGYFTNSVLARVSRNSNELSEKDQNLATEQAIDDIIGVDMFNMYKKVSRET